jgi:sugar phosphate isomerase/epimerase
VLSKGDTHCREYQRMRYIMFSKHLQSMPVAEAGHTIRALGFDGVELTVRPGGHVVPERVREELPRAVDQLGEIGLGVPALVVEVHNRATPFAADVCEMAGRVGATELRTSSNPYRGFGSIREQITGAREESKQLEALAREYGVRFNVHCHSGDYLSSQGAILAMVLDGTDPRYVGVSLDVGHLTAEGGRSGWRQSIDFLQDRVGIVAVKSYGWFWEPAPGTGEIQWTAKLVPLEAGTVRWRQAFELLRGAGWDADRRALVSIHSEYQGASSWRDLSVADLIAQTRRDFAWLRAQADPRAPTGTPSPA